MVRAAAGVVLALVAAQSLTQAEIVAASPGREEHRPGRHLRGHRVEAEITVQLPGGVPLVLRYVAGGGRFTMGSSAAERASSSSERPQREVTIPAGFYLGTHEVTQAQWQAVMGTNPASGYGAGASYPVYSVGWNDVAGAGGFIDTLNQAQGTTRFRLPTEAEWEYAARAGTTTRYSYGDTLECEDYCQGCDSQAPYMWWCGNTAQQGTRPVGLKLPNPWGYFDMHGNVYEWVQDVWHADYAGAPTDGSAWLVPSAADRVIRGGGWGAGAGNCRSARRSFGGPELGDPDVGFRLAASP